MKDSLLILLALTWGTLLFHVPFLLPVSQMTQQIVFYLGFILLTFIYSKKTSKFNFEKKTIEHILGVVFLTTSVIFGFIWFTGFVFIHMFDLHLALSVYITAAIVFNAVNSYVAIRYKDTK